MFSCDFCTGEEVNVICSASNLLITGLENCKRRGPETPGKGEDSVSSLLFYVIVLNGATFKGACIDQIGILAPAPYL